jgi:transcriptional regulator with XRE-family HTH domain
MALRPGHAVDHHPDRQRIIDDIVAGVLSLDEIGRKYKLAKNTIWKYKRDIIAPTLRRVRETAQELQAAETACVKSDTTQVERAAMNATGAVVAADPYIRRTEQLWKVSEDAIERAKTSVRVVTDRKTGELIAVGEDVRAIAPLIDQAHKNIELSARLTGRLQEHAQPSTQVVIVVPDRQATAPAAACEDLQVIDLGPGE